MVDWSDPNEILNASESFLKLVFTLFGMFVWELFITFDFEWSLITRRRKFRWPMAFFFLSRYCMLLSFIGLIVSSSATSRINCRVLYTFNSWAGNMSILCASTSLMIRTIALWEKKLSVISPICFLCFGHWVLLYRGMFIVQADWDPTNNTCLVSSTDTTLLKINLFYTMGFDLVILVYTTVALTRYSGAHTDLSQLLFKDGLVYFLASFTTNSIPAILNVLNLNPVMNIVATVPAACISVVASCRAVIRLQEFSKSDIQLHTTTSNVVHNNLCNNPRLSAAQHLGSKSPRYTLTRPEIHVTTEHITMDELSPPSRASGSPNGKEGRASLDLGSVKFEAESADDYTTAA